MKLKGTTVIVTGGASGIGRGLVERFHAEGAANIVVADVDRDGMRQCIDEFGAHACPCNVAAEDDIRRLVETTIERFGRIDLYCGNAGIIARGGVETPDQTWNDVWGVNLMAHVYAARHALPHMIERGDGYFLITASAAGLLSQIGSATYSVTKHAALALAEWLAITHGDQGIRVSALCPQAVESKMTAGSDGGVAGLDGMLTPAAVADAVVEALADERFLILPHPEVERYFRNKAGDYQRWIRGMQKLNARFGSRTPADQAQATPQSPGETSA